ncbi:ATP-binding protein [Nocardiopsis halophila]|uniref:ATP-binding protein n=1 Tax=Nocardiopsis halophila TaxID=141692 RepID=UPI0003480814|nr:helix-turn-helix transcriptional regulator [Nocardiopsis halophila]
MGGEGGGAESDFGALLLGHRRAAGMSQKRLARASGMSVRALRELEHGRARAAQRRSAEVLAEALGLQGGERDRFLIAAELGRRRGSRDAGPLETCGLPPRVPRLVGRHRELDRLRAEAASGGAVVVSGPPGVGKTALAVAAAHALAGEFPDGAFAVDLRGMDERPVAARAALERLLRALGVPGVRVPGSEAERSSLLRALLRERRVLLLLDNAAQEAQVRPLLGAGPRCLTLVTCRGALAGLEQVRWMRLDPLEGGSAVGLLAAIAGADRVAAEPGRAEELAALCEGLPLAVRIAGNRLATRPDWSLGHLVDLLRDERTRLRSLSAGDLQVRPAFAMSYRRLDPAARRVFRRLAAVPGADFGAELAAVATGAPPERVRGHLDALADAGLLQPAAPPGRFQFHDLIRIFAADRLEAEEPGPERERLREGLVAHTLAAATAAARLFFPDVHHSGPFASRTEAADWLDREAANWLAAHRTAARLGRHREVLDLARAMHWYSDGRLHERPWDEVFRAGAEAARALGDRKEEAALLNFLGWAQYRCLDENEAGLATHTAALEIAREVGDRREQAWALAYMGMELQRLGRITEALRTARRACALAAEFGFLDVGMSAQHALGRVLAGLGCYREALRVHGGLLEQVRRSRPNEEAQRLMRGVTLEHVGDCLAGLKDWRAAGEAYREAGALQVAGGLRHTGPRLAVLEAAARRRAGEYARARSLLEAAVAASEGPLDRARRQEALAELARLPREG